MDGQMKAAANVAATDESAGEFLTFALGPEEYAIDILKVQEIRCYEAPTVIANMPDFIKGVVNLRGTIVPIADLRLRFSLGQADYTPFTVVIILNLSGRIVGIVVDSVSDVVSLTPADIRPAPEFAGKFDTRYIVGLASVDEHMLIVTDIERLMTSAEMELLDQAAC